MTFHMNMLLHIPIMFILQGEEDTVPDITLPGVHLENIHSLSKYDTVYMNYKHVITRRVPSIISSYTMVRETSYMCWFHCHFLSHDITSLPVTLHNHFLIRRKTAGEATWLLQMFIEASRQAICAAWICWLPAVAEAPCRGNTMSC